MSFVTWTRRAGGLALTEEIFPTFRFIWFAFHSQLYSRQKMQMCTLSTSFLYRNWNYDSHCASTISADREHVSDHRPATGDKLLIWCLLSRSLARSLTSANVAQIFIKVYFRNIAIMNNCNPQIFIFVFCFTFVTESLSSSIDRVSSMHSNDVQFSQSLHEFLDKIFIGFVFLTTRVCVGNSFFRYVALSH